jgi:hypothetical protein
LLYELLSGKPAGFEVVNRALPDVGNHHRAPGLLPGGGRLIKTHEPYRSAYTRAVYLVRDVRDVVISHYSFSKRKGVYTGDMDGFVSDFLRGKASVYGSWSEHVDGWLGAGSAGCDCFLLRFEDLRRDTQGALVRTLDFLGVRVTMSAIKRAVEDNSIERMRAQEDSSPRALWAPRSEYRFVNTGLAGGWWQVLTSDQARRIEQHAGETLLRLGCR